MRIPQLEWWFDCIPKAWRRDVGTGSFVFAAERDQSSLLDVVLTVLSFLFWWPVGLAVILYVVGSGHMGRVSRRSSESAYQPQDGEDGAEASWRSWDPPVSSENEAFDEYRADTLRRMEVEQEEFAAFVERLRFARDKAEFDQFMAERRAISGSLTGGPPGSPPGSPEGGAAG